MNSFTEKNDHCATCEYEKNLSTLREIPFFAQMPIETLKILAYLFVRDSFAAGDYLFQHHEEMDRAFHIISGKAILLRQVDGREKEMGTLGQGEFLGGLALLGKMRQLYSLRAESDMVCLVLTREKFSLALEQFPDLKPKVVQAIIDRVWAWENHFLLHHGDACETCYNQLGVTLV